MSQAANIETKDSSRKFSTEYASIELKAISAVIDFFICEALSLFIFAVLGKFIQAPLIAHLPLTFAIVFIYIKFFTSSSRKSTPGQSINGLRVLSKEGKSLEFNDSIKYAAGALSGYLSLGLINIGAISDKKKITLSNKLSNSIVIKKNSHVYTFDRNSIILVASFLLMFSGFFISNGMHLNANSSESSDSSQGKDMNKREYGYSRFGNNPAPIAEQAEMAMQRASYLFGSLNGFYKENKRLPIQLNQDVIDKINSDSTSMIKYKEHNGVVEIHVANKTRRGTLIFTPEFKGDEIKWLCGMNGFQMDELPKSCLELRIK